MNGAFRSVTQGSTPSVAASLARNELGEHVVITMQPLHWLSADMGSF